MLTTMTKSLKPSEVQEKWYIVDGTDLVVGRAASVIAKILRGKHKTSFTPHVDCGDYVVVINADKVHFTGHKLAEKRYYHHTGYAGGIKETTPAKLLRGEKGERILEKAVQRMLPKTPLGRQMLTKLRLYNGAEHPHTAQQPEILDIAKMNIKNAKGSED